MIKEIKNTFDDLKPFAIALVVVSTLFFWSTGAFAAPSVTYLGNASSTALSANVFCLTADTCRTTWPTGGGGGSNPFTNLPNNVSATTSDLIFGTGTASSTILGDLIITGKATSSSITTTGQGLFGNLGGVYLNAAGSGVGGIGFNSLPDGSYVAGVAGFGTLFQLAPSTGNFTAFLESNVAAGAAHSHTEVFKWLGSDGVFTVPQGLLSLASSTLQNFTALQSTSTNATTTNLFSTTASSTNLFGRFVNVAETLSFGGPADVVLSRFSANVLQLKNGSASQSFRIYGDTTNYTHFTQVNGAMTMQSVGGGGTLAFQANSNLIFAPGDSTSWIMTGTGGHLVASLDNTHDIGALNATRPRTGYFGTSIISPTAGIGTTTPWATLSVGAHNQSLLTPLFVVASSSSAVATTTHFIVTGAGNVGIGSANPGNKFVVALGSNQIAQLNDAASASAIWGTNIGLVSINNQSNIVTRVGGIGWFTGGTQNSMTMGTEMLRLSAAGGLSLGSSYVSTDAGAGNMIVSGNLGIGSTTPYAKLSVSGFTTGTPGIVADALSGFTGNLLDLKLASTTKFSVNQAGDTLIAGSSTLQNFTFINATGTAATTTNIAFTTATGTTIYAQNFVDTSFTGNNCVGESSGIIGQGINCVSSLASAGGTLTISSPTGNVDASLNLGHSNIWTASQIFDLITRSTTTAATTTNLFSTTASSTNLFGQLINGFGLSSCSGTNALTWTSGSFGCAAQPQGTVTSVSGTTNRITSTGGATPVIDISASYVGQASITTVGTLSSGAVPASLITSGAFGSGNYTFPGTLGVASGLTSLANLLMSGSSTLLNFTGINSTTTSATTTSFFSTTASSTSLFASLFGVASSSPVSAIGVGVGKAITVAENNLATTTSMTLDWTAGNQQLIQKGSAGITLSFSNVNPGAKLSIVACNPGGTGGSITFPTSPTILWPAGTAPTQTTTANKCDLYTFAATVGTSTATTLILGGYNLNY